ncbi:hypothetical protein KAW80_01755 [Candidatus Babeliales bacterium]|nr:hypothetical protein [Candidatus Babeliales bacterium]
MNGFKIFSIISFFILYGNSLFPSISNDAETSFGFGPSAFDSVTNIFLGADKDATHTGTASLVKSYVSNSSVAFESFANERAFVNFSSGGVDLSAAELESRKVTNPIYNNRISFLSSQNYMPVVVLRTDTTLSNTNKICLVSDADNILTTTQKLHDADGTVTSSINGITTSNNKIFAAVLSSGGEKPFGGENSGISVVVSSTSNVFLEPADATTGAIPANKAVKLGFNPAESDNLVAITTLATIGETIDLHYSSSLSRLYVALKVKSTTKTGGAVALLVGRIDSSDPARPHKLVLEPAAPLAQASFTAGSSDFIVGYDQVDFITSSSLYKVRTLHTSTDNSYVIVNGGVTTTDAKNKIFALPVVTENTAANNGKLAQKDDFTRPATAAAQMTKATDFAAIVGAGNLPNLSTEDVREIFIVGDSVFVALSGEGSEKAGIFQSSALLGVDGKIERWTEWQRVMGSDDRVYGAGFDQTYAAFMYLTDNSSTTTNVIKATDWGKGVSDGLLGDLVSLMSTNFHIDYAGIQGLFDFSETTSSFHPAGENQNLSMAVATGYKKVALIETGGKSSSVADFVQSKGDFTNNTLSSATGYAVDGVVGTKAMVISGGVLNDIGPINSCDVSRSPLNGVDQKGWLFVAGRNGVAVLSEANGDGWDTSENVGLKSGFVGITSTMSFKQVSSFSEVRKIVCDGTNLYVLTSSSLYRLSLTANNFDGSTPSANVTTLATASVVTGSSSGLFYDFIVSSKIGLLGTSAGLFRIKNGGNIVSDASPDFEEVTITDGSNVFSLGSTVQLDLASAKRGGFEEGGTLYAVSANLAFNLASAYRFKVDNTSSSAITDATIYPITEQDSMIQFFGFGHYRTLFRTDGALVFNQNSKHLGDTAFLKHSIMRKNLTAYGLTRGTKIDLSLPSASSNAELIVRNSASGAWMVPGDWGLRLNE